MSKFTGNCKAFNQQPKQVQLRAFALATSGRCHMCRSSYGGFWNEETDWSKVPWLPWPPIGCKVTGYLPVANNFPGSFFWRGWMLQGQRPQGPQGKKTNSLQTAALGASRIQAQLVKIFTEATQLQTNQACEGKSSEVHMFFCIPSACHLPSCVADGLYAVAFSFALDLTWSAETWLSCRMSDLPMSPAEFVDTQQGHVK